MSRGLLMLVLQMAVSIGVAALGVWALSRPKHLQAFINLNFALLPAVRPSSPFTTTLIRMAGICLILYGYMLASNFKEEIVWLGKALGVVAN